MGTHLNQYAEQKMHQEDNEMQSDSEEDDGEEDSEFLQKVSPQPLNDLQVQPPAEQ